MAKKPAKKQSAEAKGKSKGFDREAEEAKLIKKYPTRGIVAGSLRDVGTLEKFGNKRSVEMTCEATGKVFRVATSDLHQVRYHPDHMAELRQQRRKKDRKATTKAGKKGAKASTAKGKPKKGGKPRTNAEAAPAPAEAQAAATE